jgi:hypothetical protein
MAGYSNTPLVRKLGIKTDHRVALLDAPVGLLGALAPLPEGVEVRNDLRGTSAFDVILWFTPGTSTLKGGFPKVAARLKPTGGLWVAWPKKASGVVTDLTESNVRQVGLDAGLVDNKVCAVDEVWSGLRFVVRLVDR